MAQPKAYINKVFKASILFLFCSVICPFAQAQHTYTVRVLDSIKQEALVGAHVLVADNLAGAITNANGDAVLNNLQEGTVSIVITYVGYESKTFTVAFPNRQVQPRLVLLAQRPEGFDAVVIEATRANKSIPNLPTRIEVLTEEIDEAASMEPSRISHLITHSTGIQVQTTSAGSNGAVVRIQGLNGRYTQMLKDGFPLYGGFSGSLDIMQIPPLDLRQVEYIKGSASTLYGGGAIGGLINLLSKRPEQNELLVHVNVSTIGSKDFNFFTSGIKGKLGFTGLANLHHHSSYDADGDGYSDIPEILKFNLNPKIHYQASEKTRFILGLTYTNDFLQGGFLLGGVPRPEHQISYLDKQSSDRITSQFTASHAFNPQKTLTFKQSVSRFYRDIAITENAFLGQFVAFKGVQLNTFSELNLHLNRTKHNLNLGANMYTDEFVERDAMNIGRDQSYLTYGIYANNLWDISKKFALEGGLRIDHAQAQTLITDTRGNLFVLPRLSALYKVSSTFSIRLGSGMGYRMPTIFNEESEPFGYKNISPIDFSTVKAEKSLGTNIDFKYQSSLGYENVLLSLNQMFFYNEIDNPIQLSSDSWGRYYSSNADPLVSKGFESQIKLTIHKFTWFVGYTYTDAKLQNSMNQTSTQLMLTPMHSVKGDLLFVAANKWRIGWDYEYKSSQMLSIGRETRSLFTTGIIVERTIKNVVIFTNAENFTDVRQTKYESLLSAPYNTPQFTEVWAPLDGFFFNAGLKIRL